MATKQKGWGPGRSLQKRQEQNPQISFTHPEYGPLLHCVHTGPVVKASLCFASGPSSRQSIKSISAWLMPSFQGQRGCPLRELRVWTLSPEARPDLRDKTLEKAPPQ